MHLIFIRHGDPDYRHNTVTEKGRRECELLAGRIAKWQGITDLFVSPYGRAQDTIQPALSLLNRTAETLPWLREFDHHIIDPRRGKERAVCWDWLPRDYFAEEKHFDRNEWFHTETFKKAGIEEYYRDVCKGFDGLLARYGYARLDEKTAVYKCPPHLSDEEAAVDSHIAASQKDLDPRKLVFVCHLGVMFVIIGYLTGISPMQLWQGFFVAPTSVTVLGAEERVPGEAVFRVQQLGDVRHLADGGESVSSSGFFGCCLDL